MKSRLRKDKNQETNETRVYNAKELFHFVDWHCMLPENTSMKILWEWQHLEVVLLILKAAEQKSNVWADAGPSAHCWNATDGYPKPQYTAGHSRGDSELSGLDKSPCKDFLPSDRWFSFSYKCQLELPRRTDWHASYSSHVRLALWRSGYSSTEYASY